MKKILISECNGCLFKYEYDMGVGYGCKLQDYITAPAEVKRIQEFISTGIPTSQPDYSIKEDRKKRIPITPDWCPLKHERNFIFEFEKPDIQSTTKRKI